MSLLTSSTGSDNAASLKRALGGLAGIAGFAAIFAMVAFVTSHFIDQPYNSTLSEILLGMFGMMIVIYLMVALVVMFVRMAVYERPDRPARHLAGKLSGWLTRPGQLVETAGIILCVAVFISTFTYMKDAIPKIQPFAWDHTFAELDRVLFLGVEPWKITMALFGSPLATTIINAVYHAWFFVIFMFVLAGAFGAVKGETRLRFFYAFFLAWAGCGVLLATVFSSAGPVYFERLGLGSEYEPLMQQLRAFNEVSPVWALNVQEMLWNGYVASGGKVSGISAMPSLHVASSVVITLLAFSMWRPLGWVMVAFTLMIFIGSIHLGWHYAVDGLLSLVLALGCWMLGGRLAQLDLAWQKRFQAKA